MSPYNFQSSLEMQRMFFAAVNFTIYFSFQSSLEMQQDIYPYPLDAAYNTFNLLLKCNWLKPGVKMRAVIDFQSSLEMQLCIQYKKRWLGCVSFNLLLKCNFTDIEISRIESLTFNLLLKCNLIVEVFVQSLFVLLFQSSLEMQQ